MRVGYTGLNELYLNNIPSVLFPSTSTIHRFVDFTNNIHVGPIPVDRAMTRRLYSMHLLTGAINKISSCSDWQIVASSRLSGMVAKYCDELIVCESVGLFHIS